MLDFLARWMAKGEKVGPGPSDKYVNLKVSAGQIFEADEKRVRAKWGRGFTSMIY